MMIKRHPGLGVVGMSEQITAKLQRTRDGEILGACLFIPVHILPNLPPETDSLDFKIAKRGNRLAITVVPKEGVVHEKS